MNFLDHVRKVDDLTGGHNKALVTKCGGLGEVIKILRDQRVVQLKDPWVLLFEEDGQRINSSYRNTCKPDHAHYLIQPKLDYGERYECFMHAGFGEPGISAYGFESWAEALSAKLMASDPLANLSRGVCLPIILPQLPAVFNYGELLKEKFQKAVKTVLFKKFPDRKYVERHKDESCGKVRVVHESHERLIARLKKGPEVALYFPNPLQGFSVLASREQMKDLPKELYLTGGIDTYTAMAMYADVLARDFYTPGLDMAAISYHSSEGSSHSTARGRYSAGLLFLG